MAVLDQAGDYADPATDADDRANHHDRAARDALAAGEPDVALVCALLALQARVEELTVFVARLG